MSFYKEVPGRQTTLESTLKFDIEPKVGSTNPVTSDGVKGAIDGAVGNASEALQEQIDEIAEKAGSGYIPKGEASVATLNALSGQENGELYTMTDAGTLTDGSLAVVTGDTVAWDATNNKWYKVSQYANAMSVGYPDREKSVSFVLDHDNPQKNPSFTFSAGETIRIECIGAGSMPSSIVGGVRFSDNTTSYPSIDIVNGYGSIDLTYDKNGISQNFGRPSITAGTTYTFTMKVTIFPKNFSTSLNHRVEVVEDKVSEIYPEVQKHESNLGYPKLDKYVEFVLDHDNPQKNPSFSFLAGDLIHLEVDFGAGSYPSAIVGGVRFSDNTTSYPSIPVTNGKGSIDLSYEKNGISQPFGRPSITAGTTYTFTMKVTIYSASYVDTINYKVDRATAVTEGMTNLNQNDKLPDLPANPLARIMTSAGFGSILEDIGFVGDSLSSGELQFNHGGTTHYVDFYEISWGQRLCKLLGIEGYNFSAGGQTAKGWCQGAEERAWGGAQTNLKKSYIIALGENDQGQITGGTLALGDVDTDIDLADYTNNADTFAGWYAGVIQRIRSVQPNAPIFVVSRPIANSSVNDVITAIPAKFSKVYLIDLLAYLPRNAEIFAKYFNMYHCSEAGYQFYAFVFNTYIDWIVRKNYSDFKLIHLVGTEYD